MIRFTGAQAGFVSESKNGIQSLGFDTEFPASYEFVDMLSVSHEGCSDLRIPIETINIMLGFGYAYFVSDPAFFLFPLSIVGFWTVILASNPPLAGGSRLADAELVSLGFRRLLPCLLAIFVIYKAAVFPPIDRQTVEDLNAQPGAWTAVLILFGVVCAIAVGQAYVIWRAGKFVPFLKLYFGIAACLACLSLVPNQTLRIHHYILALILLPGTGLANTPSMLYQGLLVGLFVAGIARWDFDSILQTYDQLRRGAPSLIGGIPTFIDPIISAESGYVIQWQSLNSSDPGDLIPSWDGFSLIVNDVERYRGSDTSFNLTAWALGTGLDFKKAYVRIAYARVSDRGQTGDYTRAAIAHLSNGYWTAPSPGRL
jgi:hypothetical protein